jgi:uncharacterized glyoxalase superfamily protein PhnB
MPTDPLDRLRLDDVPADPPRAFVNALGARLRAALGSRPAHGHAALTASLAYDDAPAAIKWLEDVLGFRTAALYVTDDGNVTFSQLVYRDGAVVLHTRNEEGRLDARGRSSISVLVDTRDDVDRLHEHAVSLGATVLRPPEDAFYGGRGFSLEDPEGNQWHVGSPWLDSDTARTLPQRRI